MARRGSLSWIGLLNQSASVIEAAAGSSGSHRLDGASRTNLAQVHKDHLRQLLESYQANSADFGRYVRYSPNSYTKNLVRDIKVDRGRGHSELVANVIVMCWAPGQSSVFHSHEGSRCFVKVLSGQLTERRLPINEHVRRQRTLPSLTCMRTDDVAYIDDELGCHQVTNDSPELPAITLHIYVPPYQRCRLFQVDCLEDGDLDGPLLLGESEVADVVLMSE